MRSPTGGLLSVAGVALGLGACVDLGAPEVLRDAGGGAKDVRQEAPADTLDAAVVAADTAPGPPDACAGVNGCAAGYACSAGQCLSLTAGLVGYWKLDEAAGTLAEDSSGSGHSGSISGPPVFTSGGFPTARFPNPGALSFDGKAGCVTVQDPPDGALDFGKGSFSISLWVYVTENTGPWDMAIHKGGGNADTPGYDIELGTETWALSVADGSKGAQVFFSTSPLMNQWVHLVGVRDAKNGLLVAYTNGGFAGSNGHPPGSVSSDLALHFGSRCTSYFLLGKLDDVRIYNRVLSVAEVAALYAGQ